MKQLVQQIRSGKSSVVDVPAPKVKRGCLLVQLSASLVSAGTERMVVEFAEKNLLAKARSRPDLVRQTVDKIKREGLAATVRTVQSRLDQPMALGYSAAGTVVDVGDGVTGFQLGDRVAVAGGGSAAHAEVVVVPKNLAVRVPSDVDAEAAAYTTLGAIALQGVRLADVKLGEIVAVIGLGLLGQLTLQILKAAGCRVIGFDPQEARTAASKELGADGCSAVESSFVSLCSSITNGQGVDAVIITAETKSNGPVILAGEVARDKAVVVAVGAVGLTLPRKVYFEKEIDFRISRSYGPGRYDATYEQDGHDYPYGYVRWTENRNMQAFVQLLAERKVNTASLTSHRLAIDDGARAYEIITGKTAEAFLGVVLNYPSRPEARATRVELPPASIDRASGALRIGVLGAGNFATAVLLPIVKKEGSSKLVAICAASGISAKSAADRFGFEYCSTDESELLNDPTISTVLISTRHHLHAAQIIESLNRGKHVFVEKPLCLNRDELLAIRSLDALARPGPSTPILMIGFNRRFAPLAKTLKQFFSKTNDPLLVNYRVNAGRLPLNHWTQDDAQGGGRLLGEGIHFLDFAQWLCDSPAQIVNTMALPDNGKYNRDNLAITVKFANGSIAQIQYLANGEKALGKERIEVHGAGRSAVLDDFKTLSLATDGRVTKTRDLLSQDKGHAREWSAFVESIRQGKPSPIAYAEIDAAMRTAFSAVRSLESGQSEVVES